MDKYKHHGIKHRTIGVEIFPVNSHTSLKTYKVFRLLENDVIVSPEIGYITQAINPIFQKRVSWQVFQNKFWIGFMGDGFYPEYECDRLMKNLLVKMVKKYDGIKEDNKLSTIEDKNNT